MALRALALSLLFMFTGSPSSATKARSGCGIRFVLTGSSKMLGQDFVRGISPPWTGPFRALKAPMDLLSSSSCRLWGDVGDFGLCSS
eukprot:CAMPEP_0171291576 /NCGR_PEP_ID=MMETSP0790-20130122/71722_1 /TAXON_ID=2925 /ORGANISM="Alexandrium catenella, Strain OF101" /LENGTH=86 /DNA_ID=CAMNT_0011761301 /DNA_START=63 /DNA_END=319 /DNA_ORIENTATION=-